MITIPFIQEESSPGVFVSRPDFDKLKDKKIILENFGTLSSGTEIMFFETQEEYDQHSIKYLPDPNSKDVILLNINDPNQLAILKRELAKVEPAPEGSASVEPSTTIEESPTK
jgi:hypothetical protein